MSSTVTQRFNVLYSPVGPQAHYKANNRPLASVNCNVMSTNLVTVHTLGSLSRSINEWLNHLGPQLVTNSTQYVNFIFGREKLGVSWLVDPTIRGHLVERPEMMCGSTSKQSSWACMQFVSKCLLTLTAPVTLLGRGRVPEQRHESRLLLHVVWHVKANLA